jgi:hypothetical protein
VAPELLAEFRGHQHFRDYLLLNLFTARCDSTLAELGLEPFHSGCTRSEECPHSSPSRRTILNNLRMPVVTVKLL